MSEGRLSKTLQKFIASHIVSVEQLEILLLLQEGVDRSWSTEDVFKKIQSNRDSISERLMRMHAQGLLERNEADSPRYRYHPRTPELAAGVRELQHAYKQSRVKVIEAIFCDPMEQARNFADAFKLRKEK